MREHDDNGSAERERNEQEAVIGMVGDTIQDSIELGERRKTVSCVH